MNIPNSDHERIIIVGGGFAGIELAKALRNQPFQVILFNKENYFTFQPLLYQVATSGLEPNSIAYPLRRLFRNTKNIYFRLAEVNRVDAPGGKIFTDIGELEYDHLVIATGSNPQFFGLDRDRLLPLKSVSQALNIRNHLLREMERALLVKDFQKKQAMMNVVVVGGGPSGVEMAGALGEMKRFVLPEDYPEMDFDHMQIYLVEGLERLLPAMSEKASANAKKYLEELGVNVHLNTLIEDYNGCEVEIGQEVVPTKNLIWTAGVKAAPIGGLEDREAKNSRLEVDQFNRVKGLDHTFAIGDVARMSSGEYPGGHPMLAPVAIQQARHLGKNFRRMARNQELLPFKYFDKGTMATVGRNRAVVDMGKLKFGGFLAWITWMVVHIISLVGFRNKLVTLINWIYNYFTYDKALRLIVTKEEEQTTVEAE